MMYLQINEIKFGMLAFFRIADAINVRIKDKI